MNKCSLLLMIILCFIYSNSVNGGVSPCIDLVRSFLKRTYNSSSVGHIGKFDIDKNPLTLGIEVESIINHQIGMSGVGRRIENILKKYYQDVSYIDMFEDQILIAFWDNGKHYRWTVKKDHTIIVGPFSKDVPIEITSPIIDDYRELEIFYAVLADLKRFGLKAEPSSAGIHIHVGFTNPKSSELMYLAVLFGSIEQQLLKKFSFLSSRQKHASLMFDEMINILEKFNPQMSEFDFIYKFSSRLKTLNFHTLNRYGTVEFRLFNSTVNWKEIDLMCDFAYKLVKAIRNKNPRLIKYLLDTELSKVRLEDIAQILEMKLLSETNILRNIARQAQWGKIKRRSNDFIRYLQTKDNTKLNLIRKCVYICLVVLIIEKIYNSLEAFFL